MADIVEIVLALKNVRQFVSGSDQASKAIGHVGTSTEQAGKKAKAGWKGVAKWTGGAAAIYGAQRFVRGAVTATEDLGKSTMMLQRSTGLDAKTASEWVTITKARGIESKQFQVGLVKLSKTMEAARGGNVKAAASLAAIGVNQDMIAKGDVSGALMRSADAFALMKNPAEKAATAQALFGKAGQKLVPLLGKGAQGIQDELNMVDKYGAALSDKGVAGTKEMIAKQRELSYAFQGLQVQVGGALLPVIESVVRVLVKFAQVLSPITQNSTALQIVLGTLTVAFVAYRLAVVASTLAEMGFFKATKLAAAGQWLLNTSLLGFPLVWIIAAFVAVGAAFYLLYKHCATFRHAVQAVWGWIKSHWQTLAVILTGPFGLAAKLIISHFAKIKHAAGDMVHFVANRLRDLANFVKRLPGKALHAITGLGGSAAGAVGGLFGASHGGTVPAGGAHVLVHGPEVVSLPGHASVTPIKGDAAMAGLGGMGPLALTTNLVVDRKVLATAVGRYTHDQLARR